MKGKKLTALTLSLTLAVTNVFCGVTSVVWADSVSDKELEMPEAVLERIDEDSEVSEKEESLEEGPIEIGQYNETFYRDEETGFISSERDNHVLKPETVPVESLDKGTLPSAFQWYGAVKNTYPGTRDQGNYGTCWAFATTACAEFDMVKNHGMTASNTDFSELQVAYAAYHTVNDVLGGLSGDGIIGLTEDYLQMGGNPGFAATALSQWKGFTSENNLPYTNAGGSINLSKVRTSDKAKLTNAVQLDINNNPAAVKTWIYNYGAVAASYYSENQYYYTNTYSTFYNSSYPGRTNHAIAIVGWDDNFSRYNFNPNNRPPCDGAWLVRNSWEANTTKGSATGYFYMSYADTSLRDLAYGLDFVPGNTFDHNYQYDGSPEKGWVEVNQIANVFTVPSSIQYNSESIDAVMLSFEQDVSINYKVEIYTGLSNKSNPTSGYLESSATTTGWTTNAGLYTVPLKNKVVVSPGESFAVVVTALNGNARFDFEMTTDVYAYDSNNISRKIYTAVSNANANQSFARSSSAYGWSDFGSYYDSNICLKAFTSDSNAKKYKITYKLNGGKNNSSNKPYYLSTNGTVTLKTPTRSGYHFLGWYTDSSFKNKISSFSGTTAQNLTLYAKWGAHNFATEIVKQKATMTENGLLDMKCTGCSSVESYYILHPTSAKLTYTKTTYSGSRKRPTVTVRTENGALSSSFYSVSYSNNLSVGRAKVTITLPSKYYTGSLVRRFSILPKAPSSSVAKLYGYNDVKFSWSKSTGADGYYVYYKRSTSDNYTLWGKTTSRSVKLKNLKDGKKYYIKVVPYFKSGDTRYKAIQSKKSSIYTLKKVSLKSFKNVDGKASVRWYNINGETGYQISRSTKKSGTNIVATYKTTSGTYKKVKAAKGKTYYYKVRAYKTVTIDGKTKKIYGPWSKVKKYVR